MSLLYSVLVFELHLIRLSKPCELLSVILVTALVIELLFTCSLLTYMYFLQQIQSHIPLHVLLSFSRR